VWCGCGYGVGAWFILGVFEYWVVYELDVLLGVEFLLGGYCCGDYFFVVVCLVLVEDVGCFLAYEGFCVCDLVDYVEVGD